jgi:biotin carboxylase
VAGIWFNHGYSSIHDALLMIGEERDARVKLLASHSDPRAAVLDAADIAFVEPRIDRSTESGLAAYVDYCLDVCRRHAIDLFVVQRARSAVAARAAEFANAGTRLAVAGPPETLALLYDKSAFYSAAQAAGIPMPWTATIAGVEGFDAALAALAARGLDACIKPPRGVFGAGFWRLDPAEPLFATMMDSERRRIAPSAVRSAIAAAAPVKLLVMEHLPGTEWSVDVLCRDGRTIVAVARRKLGRVQSIETEGPALDLAARAVALFRLSGLINVQCRAAAGGDRDVRLLEINPRMSGGCLYTRHSGVNLPWWHVALELGLASEADLPRPVPGALVAATAGSHRIDGSRTAHALERA